MKKTLINPETVSSPAGNYSQAVKVDISNVSLIFVSGQVGTDKDGNVVGENDIARQAETVFENIKAVLEASGAAMSDVVKANIYITDMSQRAKVAEVRKRYFSNAPPASTFVEVTRLAVEGWMLEIEVIAVTQNEG